MFEKLKKLTLGRILKEFNEFMGVAGLGFYFGHIMVWIWLMLYAFSLSISNPELSGLIVDYFIYVMLFGMIGISVPIYYYEQKNLTSENEKLKKKLKVKSKINDYLVKGGKEK